MYRMTQAEYAEHAGLTQQRVSQLLHGGYLKGAVRKKGRRTLIDPDKADKALSENIDQEMAQKIRQAYKDKKAGVKKPATEKKESTKSKAEKIIKDGGTSKLTLSEAQTWQARYKAALLKIEYEEKSKKLVDTASVKKVAFEKARQIRDALLNIPDRLAPIVSVESEKEVIHKILLDEIQQTLEALSDD